MNFYFIGVKSSTEKSTPHKKGHQWYLNGELADIKLVYRNPPLEPLENQPTETQQ